MIPCRQLHWRQLDSTVTIARRSQCSLLAGPLGVTGATVRTAPSSQKIPGHIRGGYGSLLAIVDEANAICMFCDAKELVQFHPPLCAECRHRASASETLKRLPVLNDPAIGEAMRITEEAFRSPPHEPSARCVDTCNNPLECKEEWDRFHGTE